MTKQIAAAAALEECRALADRINVELSRKRPNALLNVSSGAELLMFLEFADALLQNKRTARRFN
jgi:hypothetical protein